MDNAPSLLAILMYIPSGLWLSIYFVIPQYVYNNVYIYPIIVSAVVSLLTGITLTVIRNKQKQVKYIHFYLLLIGSVFLLVQGILFMADESYPEKGYYIGAVGHGILFVTGMCYVFMQSRPRMRASQIAACNFMYLFAFAICIQTIRTNGVIYTQGMVLTIASSCSIGLLLLNELFSKLKFYNYKMSLDDDFERENQRRDGLYTAMLSRHENGQGGWLEYLQGARVQPVGNIRVSHQQYSRGRYGYQIVLTIVAFLTKITNFVFVSGVFTLAAYYSAALLEKNLDDTIFYLHLACGGSALVAIPLTQFVATKFIYLAGVGGYSIFLLVASILIDNYDFENGFIMYFIFMGFIGFCYYCSNVFVLEVSNIKYTEAIFALSHTFEIIVVWLTNYLLADKRIYLNEFMWNGTIALMVISVVGAGLMVLILYPNVNGRSILELQHIILYNDYKFRARDQRIHHPNYETNSTIQSIPAVQTAEQNLSHDTPPFRYPIQAIPRWYPQQPKSQYQ